MRHFLLSAAVLLMTACSAESKPAAEPPAPIDVSALLPDLTGDHVWTVSQDESKLTFKAVHNGREFEGSFGVFDAAVKLDPDNLDAAEIHVAISMASVDAGDNDRNANLPRSEWFDTGLHPVAVFFAETVERLETGQYQASGDLALKGIMRPLTLTFDLDIEGEAAHAKGGVTFSRALFNVGTGSDFETEDWVKFPVEVSFDIKATK